MLARAVTGETLSSSPSASTRPEYKAAMKDVKTAIKDEEL